MNSSVKSKELIAGSDEFNVIISFKDEVSAFNGLKKAVFKNKGMYNNKISALIFEYLGAKGINTQFIELLDDHSQRVKHVKMIPMEIIIRNAAAGPFMEDLGLESGLVFDTPIYELRYKSQKHHDPIIGHTHALAMNLADEKTLRAIHDISQEINDELTQLFKKAGINLIDLKVEFGLDKDGSLVLADSITPDTMRLWDLDSKKVLDKDVFRKDLGKLDKAYEEVLRRLEASV